MATISVKRGDTFRRTFLYSDDNGDPIALTGCTARFAAKAEGEEDIAFCAPDIGDVTGGTVDIDEANGTVQILVSAETMEAIAPGTYRADLELTWPNGDVVSTATLKIKVIEDITR